MVGTRSSLPKSIWTLGIVFFFLNMSTIIVFSLTPAFLTMVLGVSASKTGFLEGAVEALSMATRIFSGVISDFFHKRKILLVAGYSLVCFSRPLLAMASNLSFVVAARTFDRLGNGIHATARDALITDLSPPHQKGQAFGLIQTLSKGGAFFGSGLGIFLMWWSHDNYQLVFWITCIPAFLALAILIFSVKDHAETAKAKVRHFPLRKQDLKKLSKSYWFVVGLSGFFMLSNFSGAFLILNAHHKGLAQHMAPLAMVLQNLGAMLSAYPTATLSDKLSRPLMLSIGFSIVVISNLFLAFGPNATYALMGITLWGVQMGITQSILSAMISDTCPAALRGTGFGFFHLVNAIAVFLSSSLTGYLWETQGPTFAFLCSAGFVLGALTLLILKTTLKKPS